MEQNKREYFSISLLGLLLGIFLLPTIYVIATEFKFLEIIFITPYYLFLILGLSLLAPICLIIALKLSNFFRPIYQISKFLAVGALNTSLDLAILSIFTAYAGIEGGIYYSLAKAVSFIVANINSYIWSSFFVFKRSNDSDALAYSKFLLVSLFSLTVNVIVATSILSLLNSLAGEHSPIFLTISAIIASLITMIANFLGYKYIVFKK